MKASLNNLDQLVAIVKDLGRGHAVKEEHYVVVGDALIWTLRQGLGAAFTPQVEEAWTTVYVLLATTMKEAAAELQTAEAA